MSVLSDKLKRYRQRFASSSTDAKYYDQRRIAVLDKWHNDVCSGEELPEVEIISLLEEQIPKYKLRADTLTEFIGYDNQDWFVPSPALKIPSDADLNLTPELIRETLNYFILCSNRVSQMTKTYNDIEAVTRLLEEKERDLELTARIGKELLQHNNKLETSVVTLETDLKQAQEKITQLTHEIVKKTELIQVLTNDVDAGADVTDDAPPRTITLDFMQKKISNLEEENVSLRNEFLQLSKDTDDVEEREKRLVNDITMQLASATVDMDTVTEQLEITREENQRQSAQIDELTAKLSEADVVIQKLHVDNDELSNLLHITRETQSCLATELSECKDRYNEVLGLLRDTQEQLKRQRKKAMPVVRGGSMFPSLCSVGQPDSLQSELFESSVYSELSLDSGLGSGLDKPSQFKKVFDTVRCASRSSMSSAETPTLAAQTPTITTATLATTMTMSSSGQPRMSAFPQNMTSSRYSSISYGYASLESGPSDNESVRSEEYPGPPQPGHPGVPGAADLETALKRLTPAEVNARRAMLQSGQPYGGYDYDSAVPLGCRTPDSLMSTGSSGVSGGANHLMGNQRFPALPSAWGKIPEYTPVSYHQTWKLPEKLQIVKPLEGSQTLQQWSQLAQPTFGGLLDDRHGVKIRGGRALEDLGLETFTLSDLEEDEEFGEHPGKRFDSSSCVYTYTNSTVLHPDDVASVTESLRGSRMSSVCPSEQSSMPPTPRALSRRNSCSTFSTTLGLAKMLNERGIKAVTPSCLNTPSGPDAFTPTATPCNSPDGSPGASRSPSPAPALGITLGFLNTGAEIIRRSIFGYEPTATPTRKSRRTKVLNNKEKKSLSGIRIVEKIESIGLESIISGESLSPMSPLAMQSSIYTRRTGSSPMSQLTSLKRAGASSASSIAGSSDYGGDSESSKLDDEQLDDVVDKKPPIIHRCTRLSDRVSRERTPALGAPGRPGTGQLNRRLTQLAERRSVRRHSRPDLGTVRVDATKQATPEPQQTQQSALGSFSSLLFGRKGGLL